MRISSGRGSAVMKVRASDDMRPGDAFVAMHWGGRFTGGLGSNALTISAIDPYSKQPELKHAAVRIDYGTLFLMEGPEIVLRLELAAAGDPASEALAAIEKLFGQPPVTGSAAFERAICACFKVGESEIRAAVAAGATVARLQKDLKCGTNCGSCVPELRRLVAI